MTRTGDAPICDAGAAAPSGQAPELSIHPVVEYDPETNTYAAWCDELSVATSAPTAQDAKIALVDAMRLAADFVAGHAATVGSLIFRHAPYADLISKMTDQELAETIDVRG
ncbi:MAG: hypothetical protein ACE5O2_07065 [Armatimonadota bacterium]